MLKRGAKRQKIKRKMAGWDGGPYRAGRCLMGFVGSHHVKLELFDESKTVAGVWRGQRVGVFCSVCSQVTICPACLIFKAETQTPAGCTPDGG